MSQTMFDVGYSHCDAPACLMTFDVGNPSQPSLRPGEACPFSCGAKLKAGPLPPALAAVTPYELHGVLGAGGLGIVYEGQDVTLGTPIVAKMLLGNGLLWNGLNPQTTLMADGFIGAQIRHPNLVRALQARYLGRGAILFSDRAEGTSMERWIAALPQATEKRIDPALAAASGVLSGLHALHRRSVWHLDIKPHNILVARDPADSKLIDLGAAFVRAPGWSRDLMLTPGYAPIEQLVRDLSSLGEHSDLHALGYSLVEALTGHFIPDDTYRRIAIFATPFFDWQAQNPGASFQEVYSHLEHLLAGAVPPARPEVAAICNEVLMLHRWAVERLAASMGGNPVEDLVLSLIHPLPSYRPKTSREVIDRLEAHRAERRARTILEALPAAATGAPVEPAFERAFRAAEEADVGALLGELATLERARHVDPVKAARVFSAASAKVDRFRLEEIADAVRPLCGGDREALNPVEVRLAVLAYFNGEPLAARVRAKRASGPEAELVLQQAWAQITNAWTTLGAPSAELAKLKDALDAYGELPGLGLGRLPGDALSGALAALGVARGIVNRSSLSPSLRAWTQAAAPSPGDEDLAVLGSNPVRLVALGCASIQGRRTLVQAILASFPVPGRLLRIARL